MSWISAEMMRERGSGPFSSYGEMLYQESLESLARKREKVSPAHQASISSSAGTPCPARLYLVLQGLEALDALLQHTPRIPGTAD
jgi:hypothetical protein